MGNIQRYTGWSEEAAEQDSLEAKALSGNIYMDMDVGDNVVRFLPLEKGDKSPYRKTSLHYVKGVPGIEKTVVFACPKVEHREPCQACQRARELGKSGNRQEREFAQSLAGRLRVFANVVNRAVPGSAPVVLGFGKQVLDQLKMLRKSPRLGGDFTNPGPDGFDIIIHREGTGPTDTTYTVHADRSPSPLAATQEEIDAICDQRHDLNTCVHTDLPDALAAAWGVPAVGRALSADVQVITPPRAPAGAVGAGLMKGAPSAAATEQRFDEDFNPIPAVAPDDDIPY